MIVLLSFMNFDLKYLSLVKLVHLAYFTLRETEVQRSEITGPSSHG